MGRLRRLLSQPRSRRALLLPCAWALLRAHWRVRSWPFSRLAATLGSAQPLAAAGPERPPEAGADPAAQAPVATDLRWAMAGLARAWPGRPTCLMLAVAARQVLVDRGIACELYFGVRGRLGNAEPGAPAIGAHAWLRCAGNVVTGEQEAARFEPIAVYRFSPVGQHPPP